MRSNANGAIGVGSRGGCGGAGASEQIKHEIEIIVCYKKCLSPGQITIMMVVMTVRALAYYSNNAL